MRVAISATWCETARRSLSGPPNAVRWAVCSRVASRAARAIPTAKAPTLGRKRLRVFMATRKPRSGSPRTSSAVTGTPSNSRVPIGCGESMSRAEPVSPGRSDGTRNAVMPREPAPGVVRAKTTAKSASGALEIQHFSPLSAQPAGVCSAARLRAAASEPAPGSLSANAATARPARTSGSQRSRWAGVPAWTIGVVPSPWRASAVSASVQPRARDSRSRHRSSAPEPNIRSSRPSSPRAASSGRLTCPGPLFSASGRSSRTARVRSSSHQAVCSGSRENAVMAAPLLSRRFACPVASRGSSSRCIARPALVHRTSCLSADRCSCLIADR